MMCLANGTNDQINEKDKRPACRARLCRPEPGRQVCAHCGRPIYTADRTFDPPPALDIREEGNAL